MLLVANVSYAVKRDFERKIVRTKMAIISMRAVGKQENSRASATIAESTVTRKIAVGN